MSDHRLSLFRAMVRARVLEDRLASLYLSGGIPGGSVFLSRGQEAFSAAGALQLRDGDVYAPLIRDQAGRLVRGETPLDAIRVHLGRTTGVTRGRDGNIHRGYPRQGHLAMISHLGTSVGTVAGWLMGLRQLGKAGVPGDLAVGMASIGDGGMNTGALHEGLNIVAVEKLPFVLCVTDNQLSYSTFSDRTYACRSLVERAAGYGVRGVAIDGTDPDACWDACRDAVARARAGEGPQMIVAKLLRLAGHGMHDDASYVPADLKSRFGDCVQTYEVVLRKDGVLDEAAAQALWDACRTEVAAALAQAQAEPVPDPAAEPWTALSTRALA
jgi:pyruvate dehydrogenase E1 component alpha subunit/2-oxoisovalerate dehydrogenase E1 component alpha subunit